MKKTIVLNRRSQFSIRFLLMATVAVAAASDARARAVRILDMKELMEGSQLVLVGNVRSVKPSGITTELTYPTWKGVVFEWLKVEIEVIEPIKGTKKGDLVKTLMLSTRGPGPFFNAPGMVYPKVGQHHLLACFRRSLRTYLRRSRRPSMTTKEYSCSTEMIPDTQQLTKRTQRFLMTSQSTANATRRYGHW